MNVHPASLSFDQVLRGARAAIQPERLALGAPLAIERHEHVGPGDAPLIHPPIRPSPRDVAEVLRMLDGGDALDGGSGPEAGGDADASGSAGAGPEAG